jgi:FAD/FMN-containing dehydrogenase
LLSRTFGNGNREITLGAVMNAGEGDIEFPSLKLDFPESEDADFESTYLAMWKAGQEAGLKSGANLSHHHGIGYSRSQFMEQALGTSMGVLRTVKNALDPNGILNPGKLGL